MLKTLTNSWNIFFVLVFGVILWMTSLRPELQSRPGRDDGPAEEIAFAGHLTTGTTGIVLTYRMVRGIRENSRAGRSDLDA